MRGVRVLELSASIAGAYCARLLAALGADVVTVEPADGSPLRHLGPWLPAPATAAQRANDRPAPNAGDPRRRSALHEHLDRGKRSVLVPDRADLDRLLAWADVVVSSCDGAPASALDLNARIASLNPAAVHVVVSGFGLTGPYATWKHSPLIDWASGGFLYLTGEPDREPLNPGSPLASYINGTTATIAAQAALFERTCTGIGQLVDVGAMECGAAGHQWSLTMYTHTGAVKRRWGTRFGEAFHPMSLYRCRDGWICIGAPMAPQWESFCLTTGIGHLLADERLYAPGERFERAAEIDELLQPWLDEHSPTDAVDILQEARVPASRVLDFTEVLRTEQLQERGYWTSVDGYPEAQVPRAPFALAGVDADRDAPGLGEHTEEVLAELARGAEQPRPAFPAIDLATKRVAEFTTAWAGPLTGRFLADLGLEVVKVEHPTSRGLSSPIPEPSPSWTWGTLADPLVRAAVFPNADPGQRPWNRMGVFNKMNRGKRSVCLDAKLGRGTEVLQRLLASADLVLHNFSPRGAASLGIDRDVAERLNPTAITVAMTGYGETGPMRSHASYGPLLEAFGGLDEAMGYEGEDPMRIGIAFPDEVGGLHGTVAALAGLWEQALTGEAVHIDLSQLEALLCFAGEALLATSVRGTAPMRIGNRSEDVAPHGVHRCAGDDGWVAITVRCDDEWRALVELLDDPRLETLAPAGVGDRMRASPTIDAAIAAWTASRTPLEAAHALQGAGVPACPAFTNRDLVEDEHLTARGFMATWDQQDVGTQTFPGFPIHFARRTVSLTGTPGLGADNERILASLGFSADEAAELEAAGIVMQTPPPG